MNYKVKTIEVFEKQARKLTKKYPSLVAELKEKPQKGIPLGKDCFKIRLAIKSKGKGKSGGARIITNFVITQNSVYLLSIFDKADKDSLSDKELMELLQFIPE